MKETQNIEFKRQWRDDFLAELCGFANAQGGTLYIGVDDKGCVVGIENAKQLLEKLPNLINQTMGLLATVNLLEEDGKEYLSAEHDSRPRNMLIAKVFYLAGFIESWGRGYEKIRRAFESEQLQFPTFEQVRGGMLSTIPRERFVSINNGTTQKSGQETESGTETTEKTTQKTTEKILECIKQNPFISRKELSELCGITPDGIKWQLKSMQAHGQIIRIGPDKGGHWEVVEKQ